MAFGVKRKSASRIDRYNTVARNLLIASALLEVQGGVPDAGDRQ